MASDNQVDQTWGGMAPFIKAAMSFGNSQTQQQQAYMKQGGAGGGGMAMMGGNNLHQSKMPIGYAQPPAGVPNNGMGNGPMVAPTTPATTNIPTLLQAGPVGPMAMTASAAPTDPSWQSGGIIPSNNVNHFLTGTPNPTGNRS